MLAIACVPRVPPMRGAAVPSRLPTVELPPHHRQIVFDWEFTEGRFGVQGEGVARVAPPDSVRLDLFLANGFGNGVAFLLGDTVIAPGGESMRKLLPPAPLLWGALGRLAVPPAADTVVRLDGDTLRAQIGREPAWRVTLSGTEIVRVERIDDDRLVEWMSRSADSTVHYRHERGQRTLRLRIQRVVTVPSFDDAIWPD